MGRCLTLVKPPRDEATVQALRRLLADAMSGKTIGLAYVALHRADQYSADLVGQALRSPLLSRGICRALEDEIAKNH